jgi:Ino eighty subunit 1
MRAQLRTYHAIPSLQAHQDPNSYKQLQDAPRLKSILKGASEDRLEPNTLEKIKGMDVPRTNPVNLVFTLAQYAPKVTELHFPKPHDFYDLIMRTNMTSKSRATAFLWLMWHYLESDFTEEGADENPFGPGVDYQQDVSNQGVPRFEYMKEDEEELENVDTPEEIDYGHTKMKERKRIIEADLAVAPQEYGPPKRGPKPKLNLPPEDAGSPASLLSVRKHHSKYESDADSTRSTPPPRAPNMRLQSVLNGSKVRTAASLKFQILDPSSPINSLSSITVTSE